MAEGYGIGMENDINSIKNRFNDKYKSQFKGTWISGFGYTYDTATEHIQKGITDMVAFGWLYVTNADLVEKFATGADLYSYKYVKDPTQIPALVYYGGPAGYTDLSVYKPS